MAKAKAPKEVKEELYNAKIKILGQNYESTGSTISEAITNLPVKGNVKGMAILTISKGDTKRERIINARQVFGLFNGSKTLKEVCTKGVSMLFT